MESLVTELKTDQCLYPICQKAIENLRHWPYHQNRHQDLLLLPPPVKSHSSLSLCPSLMVLNERPLRVGLELSFSETKRSLKSAIPCFIFFFSEVIDHDGTNTMLLALQWVLATLWKNCVTIPSLRFLDLLRNYTQAYTIIWVHS